MPDLATPCKRSATDNPFAAGTLLHEKSYDKSFHITVSTGPILELKGLTKHYVQPVGFAGHIANLFGAKIKRIDVQVVAGIDLSVSTGEVIGVVGESGCGKSTVARMVAGITNVSAGSIHYNGININQMSSDQKHDFNLRVRMIFQDPFASLNSRMRIMDIIGEAALAHGLISKNQQRDYVHGLMQKVGLYPEYATRYPHQFSGGQRQRIGIARALALNPSVIICDEAVAALDVSIQAQVLNLFMELRDELNLTYLFISHNLSVVEHVSDRVVIMYLGRIVEIAETEALFNAPNHPYTRLLLEQLPTLEVSKRNYQPIQGELPSPLNPPSGCPFHPRCPQAMARCKQERPQLKAIAPGRLAACHLNDMA